jgi:hypothetical protein
MKQAHKTSQFHPEIDIRRTIGEDYTPILFLARTLLTIFDLDNVKRKIKYLKR